MTRKNAKKNILERLVGVKLKTNDGRTLTVTEVYDYEPSDRSVGIMTGFVTVLCDDGETYDICDDGTFDVSCHQPFTVLGKTDPLWTDF